MLYLSTLFYKIESKLNITIQGNKNNRFQLFTCEEITDSFPSDPRSDCLYLMRDTLDLANKPDQILVLLFTTKENLSDDPTVFTCDLKEYAKIKEYIYDQFYMQAKFLTEKEKLLSVIKNDYGIKAILDVAVKHTTNSIYICNLNLRLLASSAKTIDENYFDKKSDNYYLKFRVNEEASQALLNQIISSKVPFIYCSHEKAIPLLFYSFSLNRSVVGYICLPATERDFTEYDIEYISMLSDIVSFELQKENGLSTPDLHYKKSLVTDIINGIYDNETFLMQQSNALGLSFKPYKFILSLIIPHTLKSSLLALYSERIHDILRDDTIIIKNNYLVILTTADQPFLETSVIEKLTFFFRQNHLQCALSYSFSQLVHARDYYHQTIELLNYCRTQGQTDPLLTPEDQTLNLLFQQCPRSIYLRTLVHPDIKLLYDHDKKHHTEYILTLNSYFANDRNAVKTASALAIHKSTFFFRINKISELIDFSLTDTSKLLNYELSSKICIYLLEENVLPK